MNYVEFEVIESKVWLNKVTHQKVSPYGACPWQHESQRDNWVLVSEGWTIRDNRHNTVGCGRVPWADRAEAEAVAERWNSRRAVK